MSDELNTYTCEIAQREIFNVVVKAHNPTEARMIIEEILHRDGGESVSAEAWEATAHLHEVEHDELYADSWDFWEFVADETGTVETEFIALGHGGTKQ